MPSLHVNVYANGALVGRADLRPIDAGVGTYGGPFHPGEGYGPIRPVVLELMRRAWTRDEEPSEGDLREAYRRHDALELEVRTPDGVTLHPVTVHIEDAGGGVWADAEPRVELVGLPGVEARRYFGG
jgi:hypothetical protein